MSEMKLEFDDELGVFLLNGSAHIDGLDASQEVLRELDRLQRIADGYKQLFELEVAHPAPRISDALARFLDGK